jgi:phospholipid transport system substrate-binding protein
MGCITSKKKTSRKKNPLQAEAMETNDMIHFRLGIACAVVLAALHFSVPAAAAGPRETMRETIDQVLAVLNDSSFDDDQRRASIEEIAYARFDMYTMSRLVLARAWKRFSPQQQEEYIAEFKQYLANNYGSRINRYDQEKVEILGVREEPRGDMTVRTRIVGGEFENTLVDYRMRQKDGQWLVIDVIIEGISMVSNFRDQFKEVLSRGGPDHLLQKLREKNARGLVEE